MSAQGKYSGDYFGLYFGGAGGGNLEGACSISFSAQGDLRGGGAGGYDDDKPSKPKPRRFIQKRGDKLIVTTDASAALAAAQEAAQPAAQAETAPQAQAEPVAQEISLAEIRAVAAQYQQQAKVLQMFRQRDWAEMVALYEALKRQQDEDDIEMLLLSL